MIEAKDLHNTELLTKMDPFVTLKAGNSSENFKTKIHKDGTSGPSALRCPSRLLPGHRAPKWNQSFIFNLNGKEDALHIAVWDKVLARAATKLCASRCSLCARTGPDWPGVDRSPRFGLEGYRLQADQVVSGVLER